jgi:hypothetical protein
MSRKEAGKRPAFAWTYVPFNLDRCPHLMNHQIVTCSCLTSALTVLRG